VRPGLEILRGVSLTLAAGERLRSSPVGFRQIDLDDVMADWNGRVSGRVALAGL